VWRAASDVVWRTAVRKNLPLRRNHNSGFMSHATPVN
jgi:hypothetical protein